MVTSLERPRNVLVTGGAQGIGLAITRRFFALGHTVVVGDVNPDAAAIVKRAFDDPERAHAVAMDVGDEDSVARAVDESRRAVGVVDVLVNNAALFSGLGLDTWDELDLAVWDRVMAVNVRGPFVCARQVLPDMIANGWGRIVNIGSASSLTGNPGRIHYTTSKGAVVALTRSLARAVGKSGVTVNCVAPGATRSEGVLQNYTPQMLEQGLAGRAVERPEEPEDLAGATAFLASEEASFITGQTVVVDGGAVFV